MDEVELYLDVRNHLGESVVWDDRSGELVWVNIHERELWRHDPARQRTARHVLPDRIGAVGLREGTGYVAGLASGFGFFDPVRDHWEMLAPVEADNPATRLNDGRCDRSGRFLCGGMNEAEGGAAVTALYRFEPDGSVAEILAPITCANSTCFSLDGGTLYFTDMPTGEITAYPYDGATGIAGQGRRFCDFADQPGLADGSTVDEEGCLWNAQWGGGRIVRYTPDGEIDRLIHLPVTNPTCVGFGGPRCDTLFITTARFGLNEAQLRREPYAGSVFAVKPGVRGLPEPHFNG